MLNALHRRSGTTGYRYVLNKGRRVPIHTVSLSSQCLTQLISPPLPANASLFHTHMFLRQTQTTTTSTTTTPTTTSSDQPSSDIAQKSVDEQAEKQKKKQRRRRRAAKALLFLLGTYVLFNTFAYIVLISEDNAFVMNNSAETLVKKLPLNAMSRTCGWIYSHEIPEDLRPLIFHIYAWMFDVNLNEVELPLKRYKSMQDFFTRKLKKGSRPVDEQCEITSPVDGQVMSCGVVHIDRDTDTVLIEQVKGVTYPLHHFLGYGMKDALLALDTATKDVVKDETPPEKQHYFLSGDKHEKTLHYCVLYLAPGDYHRVHSPCDWRVEERKHVAGYLFPVRPLLVKTLRGLFALNERVVLHGNWKHGDFHYVMVGATNVGNMVLYFDNTLNTNVKRPKTKKARAAPKKGNDSEKTKEKKEADQRESKANEQSTSTTEQHDMKLVSATPSGEVIVQKKEEVENSQHQVFDQYLQMRRREYARGGISLSKGEDIGYFRMGSTVVLLFEHSDPSFSWGVKPGDRVLLGQPLSAASDTTTNQSP